MAFQLGFIEWRSSLVIKSINFNFIFFDKHLDTFEMSPS